MTDWLLDTNHVSPLITHGHRLRVRILDALDQGDRFWITAPVVTEVLCGISVLPRASDNIEEWERLKPRLDFYNITLLDAEKAAKLHVALLRRGWQLKTIDALIAAVAVRNDLVLLTTDKDFRAVPDLKWLDELAVGVGVSAAATPAG